MEGKKLILQEEIKNLKETGEDMKKGFSGETLEFLRSRHVSEIGKKQREMEKIKNFMLLLVDFNINGNEIQCVDEEVTAIGTFDIEFMEVP